MAHTVLISLHHAQEVRTELSPIINRCLICRKKHSNGVWELITSKPYKCTLKTSYFQLFKLLQFFCKTSVPLSSSPLTNYAISSYTIVPKYRFRQHEHTHWLLPVVHSSSPEPLVQNASFHKALLHSFRETNQNLLQLQINTGKKRNQAPPGTSPMPEECTYCSQLVLFVSPFSPLVSFHHKSLQPFHH